MPTYRVRCAAGHDFEVVQSFAAPLPACPDCGGDTRKVPAAFAFGGRSVLPPRPETMPQTWRGTYGADRDYVTALRRTAEARRQLEDRHPELAGDRRPILAHEGRFAHAPLRAGDPAPPTGPGHPDHSHGGDWSAQGEQAD